ncbi:hypothetical protein BS50DRAFT_586405 [Corynespora cassiicola Philippines]|uniref:J domain-containing protein n=1 Tax=Corynespora cassiicola Philippines TaxID=1448308 RepID=A0A2T2NUK4_CORCC|nr:hypothetical protein BS50DRAFT_586405 [Corynespora cassiicola Philippines]
MCRINLGSLRSTRNKSKGSTQGNGTSNPNARSATTNQSLYDMTSTKRAPVPSGVYVTAASATLPATSSPSTPNPSSEFVDHYAVLGLDAWATSEEIKAAHRKLRAKFFQTDATKYQALQAAYAALVDLEARHAYDEKYRFRKGMPAPPPLETDTHTKHIAEVDACTNVHAKIDADAVGQEEEGERSGTEQRHAEEQQGARDEDPNWGLRNYNPIYAPVLGTQPYQSWIPLSEAYGQESKHPTLACGRPKYVLTEARYSIP